MQAIGVESPVGHLTLLAHDAHIVALDWRKPSDHLRRPRGDKETRSVLNEGAKQLRAYFDRKITRFDLPLSPRGTQFQQQVYQALIAIEFGQTRTYGELASSLKTAAQPVGQACGSNPIPIIIPCHRVLGADGLGGYSGAGGVEAKVALLKLEGAGSLLI